MDGIVNNSNQLGVRTNDGKLADFAHKQKFIGFVWNGKDKTVCLPEGKLYERVTQLKDFLIQDKYSYKDVETLIGCLNHVSCILPQLRCYLCSLYRWLKGWKHFTSTRRLSADAKTDLEEWLHTLLTFQPTRLMPNPAPTEIGWVGDTSTSFGIGILIGHRWAQFQLRQIEEDPKQEKQGSHSWKRLRYD
jgi:hypothetical protein